MNTTASRPSLEGQRFQVIVIGGGINGVAIAKACAQSGYRTLLVEQEDFGAGTTSRSTRIIHGGLRYLEHGEIGLVRESLKERKHLLEHRGHLVHPLQFLLALDDRSRRSALKIRVGLWLYRTMGGNNASVTNDCVNKLEPLLDKGRQWSVFSFQDAQCEFPERLVAEWLVEAVEWGVSATNHTQVLAIDVRHGRAKGVLLRDRLTGREKRVEGNWIINATGPWVDRICQRSQIKTSNQLIGGVRGSHILLPLFPGAPDAAIYSEAKDARPFFVIPWNGQTLVGTTEVADRADPEKTHPSSQEVQYLWQSFANLFPDSHLTFKDIRCAFAGIRPLPYAPHAKLSNVTRKHFLHDHKEDGAAQMISVVGGKLTTAAELARQTVAKLRKTSSSTPMVQSEHIGPLVTDSLDPLLDTFVQDIANVGGISESSAAGIVEWHGKRSSVIAQMALGSVDLRAPLCPHTDHIVAEAVDAFTNECAVTLGDVLLRRVPVALGACWSPECTQVAATRIKLALGWSYKETTEQIESFQKEYDAFLRAVT